MRITTVRILIQAVMFTLFFALVLLTTLSRLNQWPALAFWVSKFLEVDPLVALATAITTHTLYKGLIWSLLILIPTLFLGRFFCNWICPFGTLHHLSVDSEGNLYSAEVTPLRPENRRVQKFTFTGYVPLPVVGTNR